MADMHPDFPHVRLSKAPVMKFYTINKDVLIMQGPQSGMYKAQFECIVEGCDGRACGTVKEISHKDKRAISTTNLITHLRQLAPKCTKHKEALAEVEAHSKNCIELNGETVVIMSFSEAFSHHVEFMYLRSSGMVSQKMTQLPEWREYVRGFDARATFPAGVTVRQLAETVAELQRLEFMERMARKRLQFKSQPFIGLQLDMWTDTDTHTAFAAVTGTVVEEPTPGMQPQRLWLSTQLIDFAVFPFTSKTGENIKTWLLSVLSDKSIAHEDVSGITPDGAADGQCGLAKILSLAEKVDTCNLHQEQRAVLIALGLTGVTCKNPEAKGVLRKNNRVVMLNNQNLKVPAAISTSQAAADVPAHKILGLLKTCVTRWGNQFLQLNRNTLLRLAIDPAVDKFKKENKNEKEAIVEVDLSDGAGSKAGKAVAAADIGLSKEDWEASQELAGFLEYPYQIKEIIEKGNGTCTGAQALQLLWDLKENHCNPDAQLSVKVFPPSLSVADRERPMEAKEAEDVCEMVRTARTLMKEELQARLFNNRPSNLRLVQCFMSKQPGFNCSNYLAPAQHQLAETLYLQMIRKAVDLMPKGDPAISSAKKIKTEETLAGAGSPLFRGASMLNSAAAAQVAQAAHNAAEAEFQFDAAGVEIERYKYLAPEEVQPFLRADGLLDEFRMMHEFRHRFPLHHLVFKQTASHLPHEANVEQVFSRAGRISNPNMTPAYLGTLVMVGMNKKNYSPPLNAIKELYYSKFRGKGHKMEEPESGDEE